MMPDWDGDFANDGQRTFLEQSNRGLNRSNQSVFDWYQDVLCVAGINIIEKCFEGWTRLQFNAVHDLRPEQLDCCVFAESTVLSLKRDARFVNRSAHQATSLELADPGATTAARRRSSIPAGWSRSVSIRASRFLDSRMMRRNSLPMARLSSGPPLACCKRVNTSRSRSVSQQGRPAFCFRVPTFMASRARRFRSRSSSRSISSISVRQCSIVIEMFILPRFISVQNLYPPGYNKKASRDLFPFESRGWLDESFLYWFFRSSALHAHSSPARFSHRKRSGK